MHPVTEVAAAQQAPMDADCGSVGANLCSVSLPGPGRPGDPRMQTDEGAEHVAVAPEYACTNTAAASNMATAAGQMRRRTGRASVAPITTPASQPASHQRRHRGQARIAALISCRPTRSTCSTCAVESYYRNDLQLYLKIRL